MNKSENIFKSIANSNGAVAVLVDPEKTHSLSELEQLVRTCEVSAVNFLFVGGSTVTQKQFSTVVKNLRRLTAIPLVLFPGGPQQISKNADALLYLSLISGRNPDFLIGHHVNSANEVFELGIEVIPTAYILIDGGTHSSVAYVSQTTPIPSEQTSIILNTVKAGMLLGKKLVYFDAGSGASKHVPEDVIRESKKLGATVIVGGGIDTLDKMKRIKDAGANLIVIGNKIENDRTFLSDVEFFLNAANVK